MERLKIPRGNLTIEEWIAQQQGKYFCHCGCGEPIEILQYHISQGIPKYIKNHYAKVQWQNPEHRNQMSEMTKGKWQDSEYREKVTKAIKESCQGVEYRAQLSKRMKDRWSDPDNKGFLSQRMREGNSKTEVKEKRRKRLLKMWENPEYRKKMLQQVQDPEFRRKISEAYKRRWEDPVYRLEYSGFMKKKWQDPEYRDKRSKAAKAAWQNPEYRDKILKSLGSPPNKIEQLLDTITSSKVNFVGDGSWWRHLPLLDKSKNPDFKVEGQDKVIEVFGDYWHRDDDPEQLIKAYENAGIQCLVIWEWELKDKARRKEVKKVIKEFVNDPDFVRDNYQLDLLRKVAW